MNLPHILFIDDEPAARLLFERSLDTARFRATTAPGVVAAEAIVSRDPPDAIVSDLRMPDVDGLEGVRRFRANCPEVPVIVVTAFGTVETAVEAMRQGAFDYLSKPFDQAQIEMVLDRALRHRRLAAARAERRRGAEPDDRGGIVGDSPAIGAAIDLIRRVAPTDYAVLIQGESGTGKDLFARLVHTLSARADQPFVSINCSAIPEHLLESELFGHEKGAFSGAVATREGFFARADGGTLFLDEIGDMSTALQPKLLRVLQDGEYYPVGGRRPARANVRVVCATNQDIRARVDAGQFREDLFYRIHTISVVLPALRERHNDIAQLAEHFLARLQDGRLPFPPPTDIAPEAIDRLIAYGWPGNVRELANAIERAAIVADGPILRPEHLPPDIAGASGNRGPGTEHPRFQEARRAFERAYFTRLLDDAEGNVQKAAEAAGIHRATLYDKLAKLGLAPKR